MSFKNRVFSKKNEKKTVEERTIIKQDYDSKRHAKVSNRVSIMQESTFVKDFKLIYPNLEIEVYENFMNTAKLVWEEFTGSSNQPVKVVPTKKEKSTPSILQTPICSNGIV